MSGTDPVEPPKQETARWQAHAVLRKWQSQAAWEAGEEPDEEIEDAGNVLCNAGIARLLDLLIGAGGQALTNGYARVGVGNGSAAAVATQTDLSGASKFFKGMDATYPQRSAQTITFRSTFQDGEANFQWNEWCIDTGGAGSGQSGATVGAPMLNRRVPSPSLGTKTGGIWTLETTVTIS